MSRKKNNRIILMGVAALLVGLTSACIAEDYRNTSEISVETAPMIDLNFCDAVFEQSGTCVQVGCDFPPPFNDADFSFRVCNGEDGQDCSLGDKVNRCAQFTCGDKTVPVCDGQNGQPCTTSGDGNGHYTLTCPGSDPVTWRDGERGPEGPPGPKGDPGHNSVTRHTPLQADPEGECPYGGFMFESGVDDGGGDATLSDNNTLDNSEVDFRSVVCNGAPGSPGTSYSCSFGELVGLCRTYTCGPVGGTANVMGELCNGAPGSPGAPGQDGISVSCWFGEPVGACTSFLCGPVNHSPEEHREVISTVICDGTDGYNSLVRHTPASVQECPNGGVKIQSGLDDGAGTPSHARDGTLQEAEVDHTSVVCNGASCTIMDGMDEEVYAATVDYGPECTEICCADRCTWVCDGIPGLPGDPGEGCEATQKENGCTTISCGDSPDVKICDGTPGSPGGCTTDAQCDDSDRCNGTETCVNGICRTGTPLVCSDNNVCNGTETCHPQDGCISGTPLTCDDGKNCTHDLCDSVMGCTHPPVTADDDNPCTIDWCDEATGAPMNEPMDCDDGNLCTMDSCSGGTCVHTPVTCPDDGNSCTDNVCNPANGTCMVVNDDTNTCSDEKSCTVDTCVGGLCMSNDEACFEGCTVDADCGAVSYCGWGVCYPWVDLRGQTYPGQGGANGGPNPDMTPDSWDDDGDGYCETAPCMGSRNPTLLVANLLGGDCDDNPGTGGLTFGSGDTAFQTDGSYFNHPGMMEWVGDNFDNNCNGVVETN